MSTHPQAPVAAAPLGIPIATGAILSARLAAVRSAIAAIRDRQDVAAAADPTSRDNVRKGILHQAAGLLESALMQPRYAVAIMRDAEEYERMAAELAGVAVMQMAAE